MNKAFLETIQRLNFAPISATARIVMTDLLCHASPRRPLVTIDFESLMARSGKSIHALRRAVAELVKAGLLAFDGTVIRLRQKVYAVVFEKVENVVKAVSQKVKRVTRSASFQPEERTEVIKVKTPMPPRDYISIIKEAQAKLDAFPPGEIRDITMQLRAAAVSYPYIGFYSLRSG